jgi:hypothetical protein
MEVPTTDSEFQGTNGFGKDPDMKDDAESARMARLMRRVRRRVLQRAHDAFVNHLLTRGGYGDRDGKDD